MVNGETGLVEGRVARVGSVDEDLRRRGVVSDRGVLSVTDSNVETDGRGISNFNDGVDVKGLARNSLESLVRRGSVVAKGRREGRRVELTESVDGLLVELESSVRGLTEGESARDRVCRPPRRSGNVLSAV